MSVHNTYNSQNELYTEKIYNTISVTASKKNNSFNVEKKDSLHLTQPTNKYTYRESDS
jgi:hypothetical protein